MKKSDQRRSKMLSTRGRQKLRRKMLNDMERKIRIGRVQQLLDHAFKSTTGRIDRVSYVRQARQLAERLGVGIKPVTNRNRLIERYIAN